MNNPYIPKLVVIRKIISENEVNDIKTFELVFKDPEEMKNFRYRCGQFAEMLNIIRVISIDHSYPGLIIGKDREFTKNNESASPFSPSSVVTDMAVIQ